MFLIKDQNNITAKYKEEVFVTGVQLLAFQTHFQADHGTFYFNQTQDRALQRNSCTETEHPRMPYVNATILYDKRTKTAVRNFFKYFQTSQWSFVGKSIKSSNWYCNETVTLLTLWAKTFQIEKKTTILFFNKICLNQRPQEVAAGQAYANLLYVLILSSPAT